MSSQPGEGSTFMVTVATGNLIHGELIDANKTYLPIESKAREKTSMESVAANPQPLLQFLNLLIRQLEAWLLDDAGPNVAHEVLDVDRRVAPSLGLGLSGLLTAAFATAASLLAPAAPMAEAASTIL